MSEKIKLLFVSSEPAWHCRLGAHQRMLSMIDLLSRRYEVIKLAIGKDFSKIGPSADWIISDTFLGKALNNTDFHNKFAKLVKDNGISIVYFNYFFFSPVARSLPDTVMKVCDIHDVQHLRTQSFLAAGVHMPSRVSKADEFAALASFDSVISINPNESSFLEENTKLKVITIPHISAFRELEFKKSRYPMFIGGPGMANKDAFLNNLLPALADNIISTPVLLAGGVSAFADEDKTGLCIPMGEFKDPADVYPYASVAMAPLRFGSGLKIKVIESLVHGVPVAGTDCAFDGIPELPQEIFFRFESVSELTGLEDFIEQTDWNIIRDFAIEYYSPDKYINSINF